MRAIRFSLTLFAVSILIAIGNSATAQYVSQDAFLLAERSDGLTRLAWVPTAWASDQTGFLVRYRSENGSWQTLGNEIRPGMYAGRDFAAQGASSAEATRLSGDLQTALSERQAAQVPETEVIDAIRNRPELPLALTNEFTSSFDRAMWIGLGAIHYPADDNVDLEYGIFATRGGAADDVPVVSATLAGPANRRQETAPQNLTFDLLANELRITWELPGETCAEHALYAFLVARGPAGSSSEFLLVRGVPAADSGERNETREFSWTDDSVVLSGPNTYRLIPFGVFGEYLAEAIEIVYSPEN